MDSPDEWAVALRNLASGDSSPDGRALLEQKTIAMLQYQPWQQNPSVGYLEAFDVAVYLGGTDLLPTLSDLVRQQDPALSHASYLALDRLVINNPAAVLGALEAAPDLMQGREATRADYFARADVRDPQQRQVLETYLLNPSLSASELQTFAGIYPNANFMISAQPADSAPNTRSQWLDGLRRAVPGVGAAVDGRSALCQPQAGVAKHHGPAAEFCATGQSRPVRRGVEMTIGYCTGSANLVSSLLKMLLKASGSLLDDRVRKSRKQTRSSTVKANENR